MAFDLINKNHMHIFTSRKISIISLLIALVFTCFSCGSSRKSIVIEEGWDLLGERKIDFGLDKDELEVLSNSSYTNLRFKVEGKRIKLYELKIVYRNGDKLDPTVNENIGVGEYSRIIDLGAEGKDIRRIEFKYRSTGSLFKGRAKILIFGKRFYRGY